MESPAQLWCGAFEFELNLNEMLLMSNRIALPCLCLHHTVPSSAVREFLGVLRFTFSLCIVCFLLHLHALQTHAHTHNVVLNLSIVGKGGLLVIVPPPHTHTHTPHLPTISTIALDLYHSTTCSILQSTHVLALPVCTTTHHPDAQSHAARVLVYNGLRLAASICYTLLSCYESVYHWYC